MKRAAPKSKAKPKVMTSEDHRKKADKHRALGRLHEAKADMLDVDNPPKKGSKFMVRPY